jgi:hypothetical protein
MLKTDSLMDANSWDFSVTVRDAGSGGFNRSFAEFGVKEAWSIAVSGNPTGNAPPGTSDNPMGPNSAIVYSANTDYYVDVAIPHLYKNGNPASPDFISALNVKIENTHLDAGIGNSDISTQVAFVGPNTPYYVWGIALTPLSPLNNGLVSAGPIESDYTGAAITELAWWVTVPGATPEGIYWGVITITITG